MPDFRDNELRQYLLGSLPETVQSELEDKLFTSAVGLEQLEIIEEELLDDYLSDSLKDEERAPFLNHFLCSASRQEKLAYLQALRSVAAQSVITQKTKTPYVLSLVSAANSVEWSNDQTVSSVLPPSLSPAGLSSVPTGQRFPIKPAVRPQPIRVSVANNWLRVAALLLVTAGVGFLAYDKLYKRSASSESLLALQQAYVLERPLDARIGGFPYAPYVTVRGTTSTTADQRVLRERAERLLLDAVTLQPTSPNRHALGKYYLAEKRFAPALEQFQLALKEAPERARAELQNDLGVALLEQAKLERRSSQADESLKHLSASLEAFAAALRLQPEFAAARFNRALCLEAMQLPRQAIEAWQSYLTLDSNSAWAEEARRRLSELQQATAKFTVPNQPIADSRVYARVYESQVETEIYENYLAAAGQPARSFELFCQAYSTTGNAIVEQLIDHFLAAKTAGDEREADQLMQRLQALGALVLERAKDPYVHEVALFYEHTTPPQRALLLQARQHLNEGRKLRYQSQPQAALQYQQALTLFRRARDGCETQMTKALLARSHLRSSNLLQSQLLFQELADSTNPYLWIRGESLNGSAECHFRQNATDACLQDNLSALRLAQVTNNINLTLNSFGSLAMLYRTWGNLDAALAYQRQSLDLLSKSGVNLFQYWALHTQTALSLLELNAPIAALAHQQEAVSIEETTRRPLQLSRSYTYLGAILGKQGDFPAATNWLHKAVDTGAQIADEKSRLETQGYSTIFLADLQRRAGRYAEAMASYDQTIALQQRFKLIAQEFEVHRGRALTAIALGQIPAAKEELEQALASFERKNQQIINETERTTFFDKEYDIFDAAIGVAYREGDAAAAFALSERGRARSLRDLLKQPGQPQPARQHKQANPPEQAKQANRNTISAEPTAAVIGNPESNNALMILQQRLPAGVQVVSFACLPDRLLVWAISGQQVAHREQLIALPALEEKVQEFVTLLAQAPTAQQTSIERVKTLGAELYRLLIEPLEGALAQNELLCIVPDKTLHQLPFAALFNRSREQYLIERWAVVTAPSAAIYTVCHERTLHQPGAERERLLLVANPLFDQAKYPQLSELIGATTEAQEIAKLYERTRRLQGELATETAVKAELKRATIVHLATHGVIDQRAPMNSRLLLTPPASNDQNDDAQIDGALRAYEIARLPLSSIRLAVLSACQSGVERFYRGEGMIGLSRAFLAAGVPAVVASFWAVDSAVTAKLMTNFHQQLAVQSAAYALRDAQQKLIQHAQLSYRHPYYWAAFGLFGSDLRLRKS